MVKDKLKYLLGYFSYWNIKNHRNDPIYKDRDDIKARMIFRYVAPGWLWKIFEEAIFDNVIDDNDGRTAFIFSGTDNLYWLFFRKLENGKMKWKFKLMKTSNDHVSCG